MLIAWSKSELVKTEQTPSKKPFKDFEVGLLWSVVSTSCNATKSVLLDI